MGLDTLRERERARDVSRGFVGSLEEIPAAVMTRWKLEGLGSEDEPVGGSRCRQDAFFCVDFSAILS